jgi:hypothetical protein
LAGAKEAEVVAMEKVRKANEATKGLCKEVDEE